MAETQALQRSTDRVSAARARAARSFLVRVLRTRGAGLGLVVFVLLLVLALGAHIIAPYNPNEGLADNVLAGPSRAHLLGTDQLGRDVLSRIIYGSRVSVEAGLVAVGFALVVGAFVGLLAGFYGGWADDVLMRVTDAMYSFPMLVLALAIAASLGPGLMNAMLAVGVVFTPAFARLVRAQTLSIRERDFITAARSVGARPWRIMLLHIWPNVTAPVIVQASLMMAMAIIVEASLSFLWLGVEPPTSSWGSMLHVGYQYMFRAPWLSFVPGAAIFITVLGLNLLGDGLRQALDPRLRQRGQG